MANVPDPPPSGVNAIGQKPCPICGKPAVPSERPFCSKRCADVDLYRWLGGSYAIPGAAVPDDPSVPKPDEDGD